MQHNHTINEEPRKFLIATEIKRAVALSHSKWIFFDLEMAVGSVFLHSHHLANRRPWLAVSASFCADAARPDQLVARSQNPKDTLARRGTGCMLLH